MVPKILDSLERANAFDSIGGGQSLEYVIHFILNTVKDIITTNLPIATFVYIKVIELTNRRGILDESIYVWLCKNFNSLGDDRIGLGMSV